MSIRRRSRWRRWMMPIAILAAAGVVAVTSARREPARQEAVRAEIREQIATPNATLPVGLADHLDRIDTMNGARTITVEPDGTGYRAVIEIDGNAELGINAVIESGEVHVTGYWIPGA